MQEKVRGRDCDLRFSDRELGGLRSCSSERLLLRPLLKVSRTVNTFLCPQNASPSRRGAIAPPSLSLHGIKFSEASLWSPVHFLPVEPIPRIRQDFGTTTTPVCYGHYVWYHLFELRLGGEIIAVVPHNIMEYAARNQRLSSDFAEP